MQCSFVRASLLQRILIMTSLISNNNMVSGFNINSNVLCPPSLAAKEALRDLNHTRVQILKLTASKISDNTQAVLRKGSFETILVPALFSEVGNPNPCKTSRLHSKLYSPTSYMDLRSIAKESPSTGYALFGIKRKGKSFVTNSGLYIRSGGCDVSTTDLMGCLDLDKGDYSCCIRKDLENDFKSTPFFNLCDGLPQKSPDTSRLSTKRDALFAGLNLVKDILPSALQKLLELRTKLKFNEVKKKSNHSSAFWTAPTPPTHVRRKDCLPLSVDLFDNPPTFERNELVTPQEFKTYEANLDTLTKYLSFLRKLEGKIADKTISGPVKLVNNNITALNWFSELFSDYVAAFVLPVIALTVFLFSLFKYIWNKVRQALRTRFLARQQVQNKRNLTDHFFKMLASPNTSAPNIELRDLSATAPFLDPQPMGSEIRQSARLTPRDRYLGGPVVVHTVNQ